MRVGDTFSYVPETNMDSTITMEGNVSGVLWDAATGTLSASFDDVYIGDMRQVTLKAVWTAPKPADLTQTAYQIIKFRSYAKVVIDGGHDTSVVRSVPVGSTAGQVVYKPMVTEASEGTTNTIICQIPENPHIEWDSTNNRIVLKSDITSDVSEMYDCTLTVTNSHGDPNSTLVDDTVTMDVKIQVGTGIVITSSDLLESHVGSTDPGMNVYTLTSNMDGDGVDKYIVPDGEYPEGLAVIDGGSITFDPSKAVLGDATHMDYTFNVTVAIVIDGLTFYDAKTFTYRVWAEQEFLTEPTFENVTIDRLNDDALDIVLSVGVNRAENVTVAWGDGTDGSNPTESDGIYTAKHRYTTDGTYTIVISAEGSKGTTVNHYVKYDATTGQFEVFTEDPNSPSEPSDQHPWLWLLFLALSIVCDIVYMVGARHPVVNVLSLVFFAIAMVLYLGWI